MSIIALGARPGSEGVRAAGCGGGWGGLPGAHPGARPRRRALPRGGRRHRRQLRRHRGRGLPRLGHGHQRPARHRRGGEHRTALSSLLTSYPMNTFFCRRRMCTSLWKWRGNNFKGRRCWLWVAGANTRSWSPRRINKLNNITTKHKNCTQCSRVIRWGTFKYFEWYWLLYDTLIVWYEILQMAYLVTIPKMDC